MIKLFVICLFSGLFLLATGESVAQTAVRAAKGKQKTSAPSARKNSGTPLPAFQSRKGKAGSGVAPAANTALSFEVPSASDRPKFVYAPNITDTTVKNFTRLMETGSSGELVNPLVILYPEDSTQRDFFQTLYSIALKNSSKIRTLPVYAFGSQNILAFVVNSPEVAAAVMARKEFILIKTYAFMGTASIEQSRDSYIAYMNREKSLFKMVVMQNQGFLPVHAEPLEDKP